jgi:hypothetical protein
MSIDSYFMQGGWEDFKITICTSKKILDSIRFDTNGNDYCASLPSSAALLPISNFAQLVQVQSV